MEEVTISTEFIKLDQLLKYIDVAQTGGHAKILISEGLIVVNGEVCTQRGKKIRKGDTVQVEDDIFTIV